MSITENMRNSLTIWLVVASLSVSLGACFSEPDIRRHLGTGSDGSPRPMADDESLFLEVRADHYMRGEEVGELESSNVFVEIAPDRMIYSKRYRVFGSGEIVPEIEFEVLDSKRLSDDEYRSFRQRLSAYLPASDSEQDVAITPKNCAIGLGSVSSAIFSVGRKFEEANSRFVFPSNCVSSSGAAVRRDLNAILESLPPLKGLEGYIMT